MTFAHWKNNSKKYNNTVGYLSEYLDAGQIMSVMELIEAGYKAGLRAGRKDVELWTIQGVKLCEMVKEAHQPKNAATICREIAQRHESDPHEFMGSRYKAQGARECEEELHG